MTDTAVPDPTPDDPTKPKGKPPLQQQSKPATSIVDGATRGVADPQSTMQSQLASDRAAVDAARPNVPVLQKPPKQEANTDPFQAFGQPAMWIAMLGSLFTRQPLVNALNAMGGVLKATSEKDAAVAKQKYDEWKVETENAVKLAQFQEKAYDAALKKFDVDAKVGKAELEVQILAHRDENLKRIMDSHGIAGVKAALEDRKKQTAALQGQTAAAEPLMKDHVTVAEGLGSPDTNKQAQAIDILRRQLRADAGGKGSTVASRQSTDLNDVRLEAAKQDILSGDPVRVERGQRLAEGILQLGAGALKTPAPGSAADQIGKVQAYVLKQTPGMDSGQAVLKAQELIKQSKDGAGLKGEDASWMANYTLDTGDWTLISGWSRAAKDKEGVVSALHQAATQRGMTNQQINDMMLAHAAELAQVRREGAAEGGRLGNIEVAANEAAKTIPLAEDAYAKLPRGDFKPFNQLAALVASGGNSPEQKAAYAADNEAIATYARALNPNGVGRETEIETLRGILSTSGDSPESHNAVLEQWKIGIAAVKQASIETVDELVNNIRKRSGLGALPYSLSKPGADNAGANQTQQAGGGQQQAPKPPPAVGEVQQGYRFKGGDPASPDSWEKVGG